MSQEPGTRIQAPVAWVAGVVLLAAGVGFVFLRKPAKVEPKPIVRIESPAPTEVVVTGRVVPRTIVAINAPIEGTIDALFVDVGAEVIEGQLLGRIRNSKGDASVQQAQADLEGAQARLAELNGELLSARLEVSRADAEASRSRGDLDRLQKAYERQKGLWAAGATARLTFEKSEKDFNDAKAAAEKLDAASKQAAARLDELNREIEAARHEVDQKTAAIERAKQDLNIGELHSPADGIVAARHGQSGDAVDPSAKLMEIATELTKLQLIVPASPQIRAGQAATVHLGDEEIAGVVQEVRGTDAVIYFNASSPVKLLEQPAQVKIKF